MKIDVTIPPTTPTDPRAAVAAAEHAGYDAAWFTELTHDPLLQIALAGTATSTISLGTSIALAFARNPMSLAVAAHDLQSVTQGRFLLGIGSQVKAHISYRFSMPWSHPAPRMREYILAMHAIWDAFHHGTKLAFRGDFYTHTLLPPQFNPGPTPYGPPPVYLAGVGERMTEVAGEVADGFFVHGFTTARYLHEVTLPALERGRARAGEDLQGFEISGLPFVVSGRTEEELAAARQATCSQIAFYGSTPAYRAVLELHGWGELGEELHRLSREGRWAEMAGLVDDDVLRAFAVVGEPHEIGPELLRRYGTLFTRASLYLPADTDPAFGLQLAQGVRRAAELSAP